MRAGSEAASGSARPTPHLPPESQNRQPRLDQLVPFDGEPSRLEGSSDAAADLDALRIITSDIAVGEPEDAFGKYQGDVIGDVVAVAHDARLLAARLVVEIRNVLQPLVLGVTGSFQGNNAFFPK